MTRYTCSGCGDDLGEGPAVRMLDGGGLGHLACANLEGIDSPRALEWARPCPACGRPLIAVHLSFWRHSWQPDRWGPDRYCGPACAAQARNARRRAARALGPRPCECCGQEYQPSRRDARYCSTRCRVAAHRAGAGAG